MNPSWENVLQAGSAMNERCHRRVRAGSADRPGGRAHRVPPRAPGWVEMAPRSPGAAPPTRPLGTVCSALVGHELNTVHVQRWQETGLRAGGGQCGLSQVTEGRTPSASRISKPPSLLKQASLSTAESVLDCLNNLDSCVQRNFLWGQNCPAPDGGHQPQAGVWHSPRGYCGYCDRGTRFLILFN